MKALSCVTFQAITASMQTAALAQQTEAELFRARARALRRQKPWRLIGWLKALIPATVTARIAEYRAERNLRSHIKRLEELSGHLLDDVGVVQTGPSDYVILTDDMGAVRASRLAEARMRAGTPKPAPGAGWVPLHARTA